MVAASFVSALFFALAVVAHPVERTASDTLARLPFAIRIGKGVFKLVEQDLLRFGSIINGIESDIFKIFNTQTDNRATTYVASVGVGSPPTNCK